MKSLKQILEQSKKDTIVFFFGRCNPPTPAHILLFQITAKTAQKMNADYKIFISRTQDKKKNPLSINQKMEFLNLQYPSLKYTPASDTIRTPIEVLKSFDGTYKHVVMIAGSDQYEHFQKLFNDYNGKEYNFDSIKVISAGERNPDSDDIVGMSATKVRDAASDGNYKEFKKGLMPSVRDIDGRRMMNDIRAGMGLSKITEVIKLERFDVREKYFNNEIFLEGTYVKSIDEESIVYKIINRNSNYLTVIDEMGIIVKKWLTSVKETIPTADLVEKFKGITEMKFSSSDKLKVAKIIGGMLGAEIEKSSNPEQIVNAGLRIAGKKPLNAEAISILQNMLKTAEDAGIAYDPKLVPQKVTSVIANEEEDVITSSDFKVNLNGRKVRARRLTFGDKTVKPATTSELIKIALAAKDAILKNESENFDSKLYSNVRHSHVQGLRHVSENPEDQVKVDTEHLKLNSLGGPQVAIPQCASLGSRDDNHRMRKLKYMRGEGVEVNPSEEEHISDEELDDIVDSITDFDDILDAYDDDELHLVDVLSGESVGKVSDLPLQNKAEVDEVPDDEKDYIHFSKDSDVIESTINEMMTRMDRIKAGVRMKVHHAGIQRKLQIALHRHSNAPKLAHRARTIAIKTLKVKLMHKPMNQFSLQDKERAERLIQMRAGLVNKLTTKLIPRVRKIEQTRLSHSEFTQSSK